jgi:hypothetical protein
MHLHGTMSIWQREHDGTYKAELCGYELSLVWHPEEPGKRRGFSWKATQEGKEAGSSQEIFEEPEIAMAYAEAFARAEGKPAA